jgi:serine/threonine protein kinase
MHRDLKSQNILLDKDLHAKITDFGISKIIEDPTKIMTKGRGTLCWMAPEVMRVEEAGQKKRYTYKADVYSYGIVLWEIAARKEPYAGLDIFKLYEKINEGGRPEIQKSFLPRGQSKSYAGLMRCCWAQDPDQRPSMKEVKNQLNIILSDKKAEPRYPVAEHTTKHNKKHHRAVMDDKGRMSLSYRISHRDLQYNESEKLGQGGFGMVYHGMWRNYTEVAIKQLHVQQMSKEMLDGFKKEASMMASLHHPNIVHLFGVCMKPGYYSMVMEYFPRGSLDKVLRSEESLTWGKRWEIAYDVGCGLSYLHDNNILHRDLKSSNILLDQQMRAKLSDFGLSRVKTESAAMTRQSVGTLPWMAPELFESGAEYTPKADIYSYGIILWELSSRQKPFDKASEAQIIGAVTSGQRLDIPEDCPHSMAKLMGRCWAQEPKQRPKIEEVVDELKADKYSDAESIASTDISYHIDSSPSYQFTSV